MWFINYETWFQGIMARKQKKIKSIIMAEYWQGWLTTFFLNVSFPSFPEGNHSSEKSSENCPSENSYRINSSHPRDKGIPATSQKSHNVWTHMICIFFPKILCEKSTSNICEKDYSNQEDNRWQVWMVREQKLWNWILFWVAIWTRYLPKSAGQVWNYWIM